MNSGLSRKIIVASGMAVVVGIIAVTFALRSHQSSTVAQVAQPPAAVVQVPDAQVPATPTPDASPAIAQIPDAPATVAPEVNTGAKIANTAASANVEPKVAGNPHSAKEHVRSDTNNRTVARDATINSSNESASETLAKNVDGVKTIDTLMMPSNEAADSDSRITAELKSQFAADRISKDVDIGVTTTQGVVVLTGTLVTQDAIDHVKNVAENVKDVKSVDTSALKITST